MQIELKEKVAAFFWENPGLKMLDLNNCPGIASNGLTVGKRTIIEIRGQRNKSTKS